MKRKGVIRIELMSDLCVSDGGVYNSALDTEICKTAEGIPYIPAKRLKGCLRECALELNDWGMQIPVKELFGDEGDARGKVRISNAYIEDYDRIRRDIAAASRTCAAPIVHPQNVIDSYSYIRTETSVDYDTGVAKDDTLRTMRVADKGLVFLAETAVDEELVPYLQDVCRALRHMGISRTRGLGEVKVTFTTADEKTEASGTAVNDDADMLVYSVHLEEPLIVKSVAGGEQKSKDYLDGSMILGLLAERLKQEDKDFLAYVQEGKLRCSNAYIAVNGTRLAEVGGNLFAIKNNHKEYLNMFHEGTIEKNEQPQRIKHCYVQETEDGLLKADVSMEERYHHRRPEDKSIGRADPKIDDNRSQFYQISSIREDQTFMGFITGSHAQIMEAAHLLSKDPECFLGFGRSSEYGRCTITVVSCGKQSVKTVSARNFAVKLNAPTIIYNETAQASLDAKDLVREMNAVIGFDHVKEKRHDMNYTQTGGWNTTWGMRKPVVSAFDKGTVIQFHSDEPVELHIPEPLFLGERTSEGFGEAEVEILDAGGKFRGAYAKKGEAKAVGSFDISTVPEIHRLADHLLQSRIELTASGDAEELSQKMKGKDALKPVVANLLRMCEDSGSYQKVKEFAEDRFSKNGENKDAKNKCAERLFEKADDASVVESEFMRDYSLDGYQYPGSIPFDYLKALLREIKYRLRENDNAGKENA